MRVYSLLMPATDPTKAKTLISATAPSDAIMVILRAWVGQNNSQTSTQIGVELAEVTDVTSQIGSAGTAVQYDVGDAAWDGSFIYNLTTEPDAIAGQAFVEDGFNILNGWVWVPAPEERIYIGPGDTIALTLNVDPNAAIAAGLVVGTIGGN